MGGTDGELTIRLRMSERFPLAITTSVRSRPRLLDVLWNHRESGRLYGMQWAAHYRRKGRIIMNEGFPSPVSQTDEDLSGQQLGDYRLLRRLGSGAMAEVYLARQVSLDRDVAFKVLKSTLARDENCVRRF